MPLEIALTNSHRWMTECAALVDGTDFETTNRLRVAISLLHLCMEHQKGILTLVDLGIIGSAFALVRPQFEAYVRGAWYHRCATEDQITLFLGGREPPKIGELIDALERLEAFDEKLLSQTKKKIWPNLNDFTHGGVIQVKSRNTSTEINQNYRPEHIVGLLASASSLSLLAGVALAAAADSEALARELHVAFRRIYEVAA